MSIGNIEGQCDATLRVPVLRRRTQRIEIEQTKHTLAQKLYVSGYRGVDSNLCGNGKQDTIEYNTERKGRFRRILILKKELKNTGFINQSHSKQCRILRNSPLMRYCWLLKQNLN